MSILTLNELARALKNLETDVRKIRRYIGVDEMLELAHEAAPGYYGRLKH
jgi:hypothetical protein